MSDAVMIRRWKPRSRDFYVEVEHHGHGSATVVRGRVEAERRGAEMLAHARAQCRAFGPTDVDASIEQLCDGAPLCPAAMEADR